MSRISWPTSAKRWTASGLETENQLDAHALGSPVQAARGFYQPKYWRIQSLYLTEYVAAPQRNSQVALLFYDVLK
jgi:hypothetical protein